PFPEPPPWAAAAPLRRAEPQTPAEVRAEIARWFAAAGYRDYQVAALVQHARVESGFRPCAAGAGDLSYTYQWGGTRLQQLYRFAGARGCPPLDKQLEFADNELRHQAKFACFWGATSSTAALAALRRGFGRGSCY
ncbi:MAG TPA: phage tail tip lysozyme, partial [Stellaceae bacterium]|nr:phage tail tip lysozyme [Stellaceae bacterium]